MIFEVTLLVASRNAKRRCLDVFRYNRFWYFSRRNDVFCRRYYCGRMEGVVNFEGDIIFGRMEGVINVVGKDFGIVRGLTLVCEGMLV